MKRNLYFMKTKIWLPITLALLLLLGGAAGLLLHFRQADLQAQQDAETAHSAVLAQYMTLCQNLEQSSVAVTENGETIGSFRLDELGVLDATRAALDACFTEYDRMSSETFADLSSSAKADWLAQSKPQDVALSIDASNFTAGTVLDALNALPRTQPQNACAAFENGALLVYDAVPGTALHEDTVRTALYNAVCALTLCKDAPASITVELTDFDCYLQPEVTAENIVFDSDAVFREALSTTAITVAFLDEELTIGTAALSQLVSLDENACATVNEDELSQLLREWGAAYARQNASYIFDSFAEGPMPIEFLKVNYQLDQESLRALLVPMLQTLTSGRVEAPFFCTRGGLPFAIEGTYIEVDVTTQHMAYFKDGELIIDTDVVTGDPYYTATPRGLYYSFYKDEDLWLVGPTWNDFVDYWISVNTTSSIGIHDADWQDAFGSDVYLTHGSHGCINTPKEAMKVLYENVNVEEAFPILVFLHPGDEY